MDNSTWYQGVLRTYRGDDRLQTMDCIKRIITTCKELLDDITLGRNEDYMGISREDFITIFITSLNKARGGMERLAMTYNYDPRISEYIHMSIVIVNSIVCKLSIPDMNDSTSLVIQKKNV